MFDLHVSINQVKKADKYYIFDPGLQGTSRKIIQENFDNVQNHLDFQKAKHEEISHNQALYSKHLTAEQVERELK